MARCPWVQWQSILSTFQENILYGKSVQDRHGVGQPISVMVNLPFTDIAGVLENLRKISVELKPGIGLQIIESRFYFLD